MHLSKLWLAFVHGAAAGMLAVAMATPRDAVAETPGEDNSAAAKPPKAEAAADASESDVVRPTHKQTHVIEVNAGDLPKTTLTSFCLATDGNLLAACGAEAGEIRVFDPQGAFITKWDLPVRPEAINVGSDGHIYVAGGGRLLRLDDEGKILLEAESPHAVALLAGKDQLRKEIVAQSKQRATLMLPQVERYEKLIEDMEKAQAAKTEAGEKLTDADERRMKSYVAMKGRMELMAKQYSDKEMPEEELEKRLKTAMDTKLRVASISESEGEVFVACSASAGYGYSVWRLDHDFKNGEAIVDGLRGCCGQMDVQVGKEGIYVAENSRHRVCCYDRTGEMKTAWGKQNRNGLDGFGSCCNPMNVAFGPEGSVYTAESESGRVKRFSATGELIDLVGKVDLVPGCKKVALSVDATGDAVYMLDITRNHIVKMERLAPGETVAYSESRSGAAGEVQPPRLPLGRAILRLRLGSEGLKPQE